MAKVGCLCGARLSDVNSPSDDIVYIYYQEEVDTALHDNGDISLWEFYENSFVDHLHWRCNNCGRLYRFPEGAEVAPDTIFARMKLKEKINTGEMELIYMFSDVEIDTITEEKPDIKLKEFLENREIEEIYYYDKKKNSMYIANSADGQVIAKYTREK